MQVMTAMTRTLFPSRLARLNLMLVPKLIFLTSALAEKRVTSKSPEHAHGELKVIRAGKLVRRDRIFDLKTRSIKKKATETFEVTLGDQLKRLWVTRVPQFVLAYHTSGVFNGINIRTVQDEVDNWQTSHADLLARLAALVKRIIRLAKMQADNKLELRHDAAGVLEVRAQLADAGDALSSAALDLWENGGVAAREDSPDEGTLEEDARYQSQSPEDDGFDDDFEPDFTACSADDCGYCGRCSY